jgi:hypothetical protein
MTDPVLERRRRIAGLVQLGKRTGWASFGVAVVLFFTGLVVGYTEALTAVILVALLLGSATLAPAIVFGYAVRAAEREERGEPGFHH